MKTSKLDPICGMQGKIPAHNHWFCSINCIRKYEAENRLTPISESHLDVKLSKLFLTLFIIVFLTALSFLLPVLQMFRFHFFEYLKMIWIPLLAGFLIGGLIEVYVPRTYITKFLAKDSPATILNATMLGFIFSGCSHGCLAIAIEIYKKGASVPAVIAFLLASPWANMTITLFLFTFFGWKGGLILVSALIVSFTVGQIYRFLDTKQIIEKNPNSSAIAEKFSIGQDVQLRWKQYSFSLKGLIVEDIPKIFQGAWSLAAMVLWWVLIGMALASLIGAYFPAELFQKWMGESLVGMGATLASATILEICSEGSSPLAFEIYRQTHAFGNAFLFLMAGVITDYTEIGLLWTNIGHKTALWLPALSIPLVFLIAYLMNVWF